MKYRELIKLKLNCLMIIKIKIHILNTINLIEMKSWFVNVR